MDPSTASHRDVSGNQFGDNATINQGDVRFYLPHRTARAAVRSIPYPRNDDLVGRREVVDKLDKLLPRTKEYHSIALWGLGGSGKTQIALDYAYRRCNDHGCSVFWVHADIEATFVHDYQEIAKKLDIDTRLKREDLLVAVRRGIEAERKWVLILDNADDLSLFGVGQAGKVNILFEYIPRAPTGTVLWTSRDERIVGTLVGPRHGIRVGHMTSQEATELLNMARNTEENDDAVAMVSLLEELQWLPLAISQAGAYMRRTSTPVTQYLSMLLKGKQRWKVLTETEVDRHRRPNVPNSVLETWAISIERIRRENEMAYRILHVIAYVDNQNIPFEIIVAASKYSSENPDEEPEELEIIRAITRLKEFSFVSGGQGEDGERRYEMHKLVQEATRYGLSVDRSDKVRTEQVVANTTEDSEHKAYFPGIAVRVLTALFPESKRETWWKCDKYMAHAVQVGDWAEVCGKQVETAALFTKVSDFLYDRGRWREREPVDEKAFNLRQEVLGEKHRDTIRSMASLAITYHEQGLYRKSEPMKIEVLNLYREVLGEKHPDTINSMASLAITYHEQGLYRKSEPIYIEVLNLYREVLGEKHPDTINSMASLAATYHEQGLYRKSEPINIKVLNLHREVLGENHPDTIRSMASLAATYHEQGLYRKSEPMKIEVLNLHREVLGEKHPDTIRSMASLATTYYQQGLYRKSEPMEIEVLNLYRKVLGEKHPETLQAMHNLGITWHTCGRRHDAVSLMQQCVQWQVSTLGSDHPSTDRSVEQLAEWNSRQSNRFTHVLKRTIGILRR